jgi:hypothetical protein
VSTPPSHLDLLTATRSLRRAAVAGRRDAVRAELSRLRTALVLHLHAEHELVASLPGTLDQLTREGQQRLLGALNKLLFSAEGDGDTCTCIVRAAEVEALLRRQVKLEAAALRASAPTDRQTESPRR